MRLAVVPGSYDPPTNGHLDLIRRASALFDDIVVLVAENSMKKCLFTVDERVDMLRSIFCDNRHIRVDSCSGLVAAYAKSINADTLVRGIRNASDYSYETEIFQVNRTICKDLETVFILAGSQFSSIRSSSIRELAFYGQDVSLFVPPVVSMKLKARIEREEKK